MLARNLYEEIASYSINLTDALDALQNISTKCHHLMVEDQYFPYHYLTPYPKVRMPHGYKMRDFIIYLEDEPDGFKPGKRNIMYSLIGITSTAQTLRWHPYAIFKMARDLQRIYHNMPIYNWLRWKQYWWWKPVEILLLNACYYKTFKSHHDFPEIGNIEHGSIHLKDGRILSVGDYMAEYGALAGEKLLITLNNNQIPQALSAARNMAWSLKTRNITSTPGCILIESIHKSNFLHIAIDKSLITKD